MTKDEALKLALEALEWSYGGEPMPTKELEAINALRQVLAEPSEPIRTPSWTDVARLYRQSIDDLTMNFNMQRFATLLANDIQQMNGRESIFERYQSYNDMVRMKSFIENHNRSMGWADDD